MVRYPQAVAKHLPLHGCKLHVCLRLLFLVQVFAQQHPLVLKLEADVMAKVLSCSEPLDRQSSQQDTPPSS
jgi:hypothetical protein